MPVTDTSSEELVPHVMAEWLIPLEHELGWEDHGRAWHLLIETLHALRDLLPAHDAVKLGAQLPFLMRGTYFQDWAFFPASGGVRGKTDFIDEIAARLVEVPLNDADHDIRAVLDLLRRRLPEEGFERIVQALRPPLRDFDRKNDARG